MRKFSDLLSVNDWASIARHLTKKMSSEELFHLWNEVELSNASSEVPTSTTNAQPEGNGKHVIRFIDGEELRFESGIKAWRYLEQRFSLGKKTGNFSAPREIDKLAGKIGGFTYEKIS